LNLYHGQAISALSIANEHKPRPESPAPITNRGIEILSPISHHWVLALLGVIQKPGLPKIQDLRE